MGLAHTVLQAVRGDDAVLILALSNADGTATDLTGKTVTWAAKANPADADPALGPYTAIVLDALAGTCKVTIPRAATAATSGWAYAWDAQMTDGSLKEPVARGVLVILDGYTA